MGIYDRPYAQNDQPGLHLSVPQSMTVRLIVVTSIAYVLQLLASPVEQFGALRYDWFQQPWLAFELLSYGFLHSTTNVWHILINMFVLWMFGREVESRYGQRSFLAFYLTAIVIAGLVWSVIQYASGQPATLVGASGATAGVVALFALNYPRRQVYFMFFIPMPMWVAGSLMVLVDIRAAMGYAGNVAGTAHLAGIAFALLFYRYGQNPGLWAWDRFGKIAGSRRPRLRVHRPDVEERTDDGMSEEVDDILRKIQLEGQDSLTRRERRILEKASRKYKQRR